METKGTEYTPVYIPMKKWKELGEQRPPFVQNPKRYLSLKDDMDELIQMLEDAGDFKPYNYLASETREEKERAVEFIFNSMLCSK